MEVSSKCAGITKSQVNISKKNIMIFTTEKVFVNSLPRCLNMAPKTSQVWLYLYRLKLPEKTSYTHQRQTDRYAVTSE